MSNPREIAIPGNPGMFVQEVPVHQPRLPVSLSPVDHLAVAKALTQADLSPSAVSGARVQDESISFTTPSAREVEINRRGDTIALVGGVGSIIPPEDPDRMLEIYDLSAYLAPILQAIGVAVYQTGWRLEPIIDLTRPRDEVSDIIRDALEFERASGSFENEVKIGRRDINEEYKRLQRRSRREAQFVSAFFGRCCPSMSYERLLAITGLDQEITGNGWWEVLRDSTGRPARFLWVPSRTVRAVESSDQLIGYLDRVPLTRIRWEIVEQYRRFPRYIQLLSNGYAVWFKGYGDPRFMSRWTGTYFSSLEELQRDAREISEISARTNGKQTVPQAATELLQFAIPYSGSSYYGRPDHAPAYPDLAGGRDLSEENMKIVSDEAIPSMMVLCSGGRVGGEDQTRIREQIMNRKKGRKQILFLNAYASGNSPVGPSVSPTLKIEHTRPLQTNDALFLKYGASVEQRAHGVTRTPFVVLGKHEGINRATMLGLRRFFDEDVAAPKRAMQVDDPINRHVLPSLDIQCWKYRSKARPPTDPEAFGSLVSKAMDSGWLSPDDARRLGGPTVFNESLSEFPGLWSELTTKMVTAALQTKNQELAAAFLQRDPGAQDRIMEALKNLIEGKSEGDVTGGSRSVQKESEDEHEEEKEEK